MSLNTSNAYCKSWGFVGEELLCKYRVHNLHDSFTVAVRKDHMVV